MPGRRVRRVVCSAGAAAAALVLSAALPSLAAAQDVFARVTNQVPAFLAFHQEFEAWIEERRAVEDTAAAEDRDAAEVRWALWLEHGVHPILARAEGAATDAARERLDAVFDRYRPALPRLREQAEGFTPAPEAILRGVARTLRLDRPLEVELVAYVGLFDERPRYELGHDGARVLFPVEVQPAAGDRRTELVHLFSEAVHARLAGRRPDAAPTVAERLLSRGLALRVHEAMAPGLPTERYLGRSLDWLLSAEGRDGRLLESVRPRLVRAAPEAPAGLVAGRGPTGLEGELDYVAWRLVGHLQLHQGWTLDRLARVPAREIPALVADAVDEASGR